MSNSPSSNNEDRLEQIVAYLDGELSPVEASLVERQLAEDPDFRQEMQGIERAWEALDALPATPVNDRFSQTTMELVVSAARQDVIDRTRALPVQRRNGLLGKVLLTCAAAALGFLLIQLVRQNPNRVLLADLPVIHYIDVYSQFRDVDFVRRLNEQLGDDVWVPDLSGEELAEQHGEFKTIAAKRERRQWIDQLDEQDRAALRARYNRFVSLTPDEQNRLRQLHQSMITAPDGNKLQRTLLQYQTWVTALPASRQFELRNMSVIDRVREVVTQVRREANNPWIILSPGELRRLDRALVPIRQQLFRETGPPQRGGGRGSGMGPRPDIRRKFMEHRDEWLPQILDALAPETREKFETLSPVQQLRQASRWIADVRNWERGPRLGRQRFDGVSQQELEEFFVEQLQVSPERVEQWLAQPRDIMEEQLKRAYLRDEFGPDVPGMQERPLGPPPGPDFDRRPFDRPPGDLPFERRREDRPPPRPPRE